MQTRRDRLAGIKSLLLVADYKALEVVILADLCLRLFGDDQLAKAVAPGAPDIHSVNAKFIFGEYLNWKVPVKALVEGQAVEMRDEGRRVQDIPTEQFKEHPYGAILRGSIKEVFYGWCYGKRGYGFSTLIGADGKMIGEERGNQIVAGLLEAMPGLGKWENWVTSYVRKWHGIYSLGGRWCCLKDLMESGQDWMVRRAIRRALNFPCQASGADIVGDAMVRVRRDEDLSALGYRMILNVHDEIVMRGPEVHAEQAKERLTQHMVSATANGTPLLIPLQVSAGCGANYFDAK